jgi:hypothetical protein
MSYGVKFRQRDRKKERNSEITRGFNDGGSLVDARGASAQAFYRRQAHQGQKTLLLPT